jgi:hypothetical protein
MRVDAKAAEWVDRLYEQGCNLADASLDFDSLAAANAYLHALRGHASDALLMRRFEAGTDWSASSFKKAMLSLEAKTEKLMAQAYIAGDPLSLEPELRNGYDMARKESSCLALDDTRWLYFVGCGAAPLTAMRYHDLCGARTVCIDQDAEALGLARELLQTRYGEARVASHFHFVHATAESLSWVPERRIERLLLAAHCPHKEALMRQLETTLHPACRVLVRLPLGAYRHVYDEVNFARCGAYRFIETVSDDTEPYCQAALLTPQQGSQAIG